MGDTLYPTIPTADPNPIPTPDPTPTPTPTPGQPKDKVDPQVIDALTINMLTTTASSASFAMANLYQHQINHARRLDSMAEACLAKMLKRFSTQSPEESVAISKIFQAESDSSIGSLLAQLSAGQIGTKIGQSTPGSLAADISQMNAAVASMNGLIGGIVALLQQTLLTGTNGIPVQTLGKRNPKVDPAPVPVPPVPAPAPAMPEGDTLPDWPTSHKFPRVTIRY